MSDHQATTEISSQFLGFRLGDGAFIIAIERVREVLDPVAITRVPKMPPSMLGVINLRGQAIPLLDMRLLLGIEATKQTEHTCFIILDVLADGKTIQVGGLADSVEEVISLGAGDIKASPRTGLQMDDSFAVGMVSRETGFMIVLDVDRMFSDERALLRQIVDSGAVFGK